MAILIEMARRALLPFGAGIAAGQLTAGGGASGGGDFRGFGPGFDVGDIPIIGGLLGAQGGMKRRRRRRKALSNTDMATALTIASAISKKAAENFILMRVRRG